MKTNTKNNANAIAIYSVAHYGRKNRLVAEMIIKANSPASALAEYLRVYTKQTAENCVVTPMGSTPTAEVKAQPKAVSKKAEPKAKAQPKAEAQSKAAARRKAKADKVTADAKVVPLAEQATSEPKAETKAEAKLTQKGKDAVKHIAKMQGVTLSHDRGWLWVGGDTKPHKETLKGLGFRFSGRRQAWFLLDAVEC